MNAVEKNVVLVTVPFEATGSGARNEIDADAGASLGGLATAAVCRTGTVDLASSA